MTTVQTEDGSSGPTVPAKIFCGGLSDATTNASLRTHFSPYGEIVDSVVLTEKTTGRSRGFGFITFASEESVDAVLSSPQIVDGKEIDCKRAVPRGAIQANETDESADNSNQSSNISSNACTINNGGSNGTSSNSNASGKPHTGNSSGGFSATKIFVGGLPQSCTDEKLREHFGKYGTIKNLSVMVDRDTNRHRGFGFVEYESSDAVEEVMRHYYDHQIDNKWVECKKALPREIMAGNSNQTNSGGHGPSLGNPRARANPALAAASATASSNYADYYRNPYLPVHAGGVPSQQVYGRYGRHDPRYMYTGYASGYSSNIYSAGGYGQMAPMHHAAASGPSSPAGVAVSMPTVIPTIGSHYGDVSPEQAGIQVQPGTGSAAAANSSNLNSSVAGSGSNSNSGSGYENQEEFISEKQGVSDSNLHSYTAASGAQPAAGAGVHPPRPGMPPHMYPPGMPRAGPYTQGRYAPPGTIPYSVPGSVPTHGRPRGMY
ncbi:RRM domain-containing protein [Cryptosporidium canis]|uniref:RRM domain-containing protein n=1 Tax=Cryptosporidium canis TaxID=195482 RepID=A0ABQ8P8G5_9CRYT|nr:RRM domain-containing protein [Cryptosporidium canis]KAJ1613867.1 RRM domain-containing protein [Cryptosporidium canis]